MWAALVRRVVAHPAIWGATAALALIALAAPAAGLRLGEPAVDVPPGQPVLQDLGRDPAGLPANAVTRRSGGAGPDATGPRVLAAVAALQGRRGDQQPFASR